MKKHAIRRRLGWHPDHPDQRDHVADNLTTAELRSLPPSASIEAHCPPVYDQGALGSCVYNAWAGAVHYRELVKTGESKRPVPSRLFGYYNGRKEQGTVHQDSGSTLRMGGKVYHKYGYCPEQLCTYNIKKFDVKPSDAAYATAAKHELVTNSMYVRLTSAQQIKNALAQQLPVVFGFTVYDSFEQVGKDGMVPLPGRDESVLGGHAVMIVGYDDKRACYRVRNSWGPKWGDRGYCWMPYAYVNNPQLAQDFWTVLDLPATDPDGDN